MLYHFNLYIEYPEQGSLLDDWFLFLFSLTLLFYGYVLGGSDKFWDTCAKYRYYFLGIAIACIMYLFPEYWWNLNLPKVKDKRLYIFGILNSIHIWMIILSILGFAKTHLNFSNNFLETGQPGGVSFLYPAPDIDRIFWILYNTMGYAHLC